MTPSPTGDTQETWGKMENTGLLSPRDHCGWDRLRDPRKNLSISLLPCLEKGSDWI